MLHHQIRIAEAEDPGDAELLGEPEPMRERLVLRDIVGAAEVNLQDVVQPVTFRGGDEIGRASCRERVYVLV